jgi:hypothetical protein
LSFFYGDKSGVKNEILPKRSGLTKNGKEKFRAGRAPSEGQAVELQFRI